MSYFPIVIRYIEEEWTRTILKPEDIECGRKFRVLRTAYDDRTIIHADIANKG